MIGNATENESRPFATNQHVCATPGAREHRRQHDLGGEHQLQFKAKPAGRLRCARAQPYARK